MRLHPILVRLLLQRGVALWIGAGLVVTPMLLGSRGLAPGPLTWHLGPAATAWFLIVLALVTWIDLRRRRELMLISNLGVAHSWAVVVACLPALAGEMAIVALLP